MKKLKKNSIIPEKVIKNDELVNLRGGYWLDCDSGETHFYCECSTIPGAWEACYSHQSEITADLKNYCEDSLGNCNQI